MRVQRFGQLCLAIGLIIAVTIPAAAQSLNVHGNRITLDGRRGEIVYRDCGDLDRDGAVETVMSVRMGPWERCSVIVARETRGRWQLVTRQESEWKLRTDVTDINGDGRPEIIARAISGDGHWFCTIYRLKQGRLAILGDFGDTKFRDLSGDGVPEALSLSMVSAGFIGDHWLTIYKWNGRGYTDVSRRFPCAYDSVIRDLRRVIHDLRFTKSYGSKLTPRTAPDVFADLYHYLGKAFEYRGQTAKAKVQYAISSRLRTSAQPVKPIRRPSRRTIELTVE